MAGTGPGPGAQRQSPIFKPLPSYSTCRLLPLTHVTDTLQSPILLAGIITRTQRGRFYDRIDSSGETCWLWSAGKDTNGYGQYAVGAGVAYRQVNAHRLAWALENPAVDLESWQFVLHECDNPPCCRLDHLFLGNSFENTRDMMRKGRAKRKPNVIQQRGETHYKAKLTEAGVYEIRASTELTRVLAARFGVSGSTINSVRDRRTWRHLEEDDLDALFGPS